MVMPSSNNSLQCCVVKTDDNLSRRKRAKVKPVNITVSIVEDDAPLRGILSEWIRDAEGFKCVGTHENAEAAIAALPQENPSVVLMDINMPGMNGIEAVATIRKKDRSLPILMLTVFDDNQHVFDAICAGASGYLLKKHISTRLFSAITDIIDGGTPMSPSIARMVLNGIQQKQKPATDNPYQLTPREKEVLLSLSKGNSYKLVAADVQISIDTVRSHIRNIYEKLHVHSQTEAVSKAIREKLV